MALELPSCTITIRVLKDICRRVPAWGVLDSWVYIAVEPWGIAVCVTVCVCVCVCAVDAHTVGAEVHCECQPRLH